MSFSKSITFQALMFLFILSSFYLSKTQAIRCYGDPGNNRCIIKKPYEFTQQIHHKHSTSGEKWNECSIQSGCDRCRYDIYFYPPRSNKRRFDAYCAKFDAYDSKKTNLELEKDGCNTVVKFRILGYEQVQRCVCSRDLCTIDLNAHKTDIVDQNPKKPRGLKCYCTEDSKNSNQCQWHTCKDGVCFVDRVDEKDCHTCRINYYGNGKYSQFCLKYKVGNGGRCLPVRPKNPAGTRGCFECAWNECNWFIKPTDPPATTKKRRLRSTRTTVTSTTTTTALATRSQTSTRHDDYDPWIQTTTHPNRMVQTGTHQHREMSLQRLLQTLLLCYSFCCYFLLALNTESRF